VAFSNEKRHLRFQMWCICAL